MTTLAEEIGAAEIKFSMFDHVPVGVCILKMDLTVLFWNTCIEDWTGIQRKTIIGSDISLYFPHLKTPKYSSRLQNIFEGGPPTIFSSQLHHNIIPARLWDGRLRVQHTIVTAIQALAGTGYYALCAIQDVTDLSQRISDYRDMRDKALEEVRERKRAEEELHEIKNALEYRVKERTAELVSTNEALEHEIAERLRAEAELRSLISMLHTTVSHMPEGVVLLDADDRVVLTNEWSDQYLAILSSVKKGEVLELIAGRPLHECFPESKQKLWQEIVTDAPQKYIFEIAGSPIRDGSQVKGMVLVLKDVTEARTIHGRMQAQERLAAVGQLAAGIAHDFNNILTGIIGFAEIMSDESSLSDEGRQIVEAILQNGLRAAHLIKQILDFSRKSISEMKSLELRSFLNEFTKFIRRTIPENIQISLVCGEDAYYVRADPTKIQQVLANLALNARDAMPEGGALTFDLKVMPLTHKDMPPLPGMPEGDWVVLAVTDTGSGMSAEVLSHVFEPFYTTKEVGKGTGLGLSQVYGIVKQHNGFIDVRSGVGKGSLFTLYFPAASPRQQAPVAINMPQRIRGEAETILVVEDSESICNLIARKLTSMNFNVLIASNGKDALRKFEGQLDEIKLVITDLVMPEMGGLEISRLLISRKPSLKVIALSGYPLGSDQADIKEAGITEFIEKPFQVQTLADAVYRALGKK
ncbi:MAG: response regulator [Nitrospirae bacterium]|nr:MAG: response regulator [Nitrospirota bacterium]